MKLNRSIVISVGVVAILLTSLLAFKAVTVDPINTMAPTLSPNLGPPDSGQARETHTVTRPIRELHTKVVKYTVMLPVREKLSRTVAYTQMTIVREQIARIDPETGKERKYTVTRHVPEQREKLVNYTVCRMVPEQRYKTVKYQTVRYRTLEVPRK